MARGDGLLPTSAGWSLVVVSRCHAFKGTAGTCAGENNQSVYEYT